MKMRTLILAVTAIISLMVLNTMAYGAQRRINEREVRDLIRRIETGADRFQQSLDKALDHSKLDGSRREDNINEFVKDFEHATDRLKDRVEGNRATNQEVEDVLGRGVSIDNFMRRHRLDSRSQNDWASLRRDLDSLARVYSVSTRWERDARYDRRDRDRDRRYGRYGR